jgi:hypothetical protein
MQISITRGLAELKVLDSRIQAAISSGTYVAVTRGAKDIPLNIAKSAEQLSKDIKAAVDSVESLIKRREAIKRAIIVSNGQTKVSIGGVEMTVAEAIEKKSSIKYLEQFHGVLNSQLVNANYQIQSQNARVEADIEKRALALFGSDKNKVSSEQMKVVSDAVKSESEAKLLDPIGVEAKAKAVWKAYEDFATEVDFALSESNAKTSIEVPA